MPPIDNIRHQVNGKAGALYARNQLEENRIEVDVRLIRNTRQEVQDYVRMIAGKLYSKTPQKLYLRDEPNRFNIGILNGDINFEKNLRTGFATLEFICPDPLAYSEEKAQAHLENAVFNNGTYPTRGTIKIKMNKDVEYLKVTLQNTGEYLYLEDDFKKGDEIVIDLIEEWVKKNNYLIMDKLHYESDFFDLPVGEFKVILSDGNGLIEFRNRWL